MQSCLDLLGHWSLSSCVIFRTQSSIGLQASTPSHQVSFHIKGITSWTSTKQSQFGLILFRLLHRQSIYGRCGLHVPIDSDTWTLKSIIPKHFTLRFKSITPPRDSGRKLGSSGNNQKNTLTGGSRNNFPSALHGPQTRRWKPVCPCDL